MEWKVRLVTLVLGSRRGRRRREEGTARHPGFPGRHGEEGGNWQLATGWKVRRRLRLQDWLPLPCFSLCACRASEVAARGSANPDRKRSTPTPGKGTLWEAQKTANTQDEVRRGRQFSSSVGLTILPVLVLPFGRRGLPLKR